MHYFLIAVWALLNVLAYIGYGQLVWRFGQKQLAPWPLAGTIGISFLIAIGGYLNLARCLTHPVLAGIVFGGVALWLLNYRNHWRKIYANLQICLVEIKGSTWKTSVAFVLLVLLAAAFFGNLVRSRFNPADDLIAYASYAVQTSQLGFLPADPFGERRIQSSLGSGYLLQAMVLVVGDARSIYIPDISLGYLLSVGAAYFIARRRLRRGISLVIASLVFVLAVYISNATFYILPEALVLTLFWMAAEEPAPGRSWGFLSALIGVVAATLATLKSTYIPFSCFFCLFLFLSFCVLYGPRQVLRGVLVCAAGDVKFSV